MIGRISVETVNLLRHFGAGFVRAHKMPPVSEEILLMRTTAH